MRLTFILSILLISAPEAFATQPSGKLRMATESEIRQHLQRAGSLKDGTDGYQYIEGNSVGYKISDGRICVKKRHSVDCADVLFDGARLEMVDGRGNREIIGN
jgi:hypothetical protein